jgi:hypothetical protein
MGVSRRWVVKKAPSLDRPVLSTTCPSLVRGGRPRMGYLSGRTGWASTHSIARRGTISGPEGTGQSAQTSVAIRGRADRPALMRDQSGTLHRLVASRPASVVSFARSGFGLTGPDNGGNPVATCQSTGFPMAGRIGSGRSTLVPSLIKPKWPSCRSVMNGPAESCGLGTLLARGRPETERFRRRSSTSLNRPRSWTSRQARSRPYRALRDV